MNKINSFHRKENSGLRVENKICIQDKNIICLLKAHYYYPILDLNKTFNGVGHENIISSTYLMGTNNKSYTKPTESIE